MIKAVIFDYDETLVKTLDSRIKVYIALAKNEYDLTLTESQIRKAFGFPYNDFIKRLFGDVDAIESIISKYQALSQNFPNLAYEGGEKTVNSLIKKYLVGIVSGIRRKGILNDLSKLKYPTDKFFFLQCGDDITAQKPDPKVFAPLLTELNKRNIKPSETVYIGDDLKDFKTAIGVGFHFIGVAGHTNPKQVFVKAKAQYVTDFADLEMKISQIS